MKPTILNQRYRLGEHIGTGGMATVYRGEDLLLERPVAVKFLRDPYASDPEAHERFLAEARAAARLDHPNIVHIYDVGEDGEGRPYMIMDLVAGEDLKSLLRREGALTVPHALALTRQICAGVGHAHRAGIVHCDLKPQNILLTRAGQLKVADFGIAHALRPEEEPRGEAAPARVVWGSPHYLSPEQARGAVPTPASDVYSIGVMLYEMLTGVPPFHDPDPTRLVLKHLQETPPSPSSLNPRVPPGLEWLVNKILSKEPAHRYRNADQLGVAIDEYLRQGGENTSPYATVAEETPLIPTRLLPSSERQEEEAADLEASTSTQPVPARAGPDFMLWALILVAAIAVLGLIPLWLFVYQTYSAPAPIATPRPGVVMTATPTRTVAEVVSVPNLRSLSVADAQRLLENEGLVLEVLGEEETTEERPGAIWRQTPEAGARVDSGTVVSVIVAQGRPYTLPEVVGYQLGEIQPNLEAQGLLVEVMEVRSSGDVGVILEQAPPPETQLRAGLTVTLTVSGGPNLPIPLAVNLNNQVVLEQAQVSKFRYRPGDSVPVTLRWHVLEPFDHSYKVFVHLLTSDMSRAIAQQDIEPVNGMRPTQTWSPGEIINDPHQVILPSNTPPGTYQIRVGLYDPNGRLPVVDPGVTEVIDHTIFVSEIEVAPSNF